MRTEKEPPRRPLATPEAANVWRDLIWLARAERLVAGKEPVAKADNFDRRSGLLVSDTRPTCRAGGDCPPDQKAAEEG